MIIAHDISAMNTGRQLNIFGVNARKAMERLSSGYRVNRAADNAAGLTISEKMRSQIRGLGQASKNAQDGIQLCNVADGALQEVQSILGRMRELAVQAANDTNVTSDRTAIDMEIDQLKKEIDAISNNTEYNTKKLFRNQLVVELSDRVNPVQIYIKNNSTGSSGDFNGIIVNGDRRIPWTDIDPNMTYFDADEGKMKFNEGIYRYSVAADGNNRAFDISIECKDGSEPPQIEVEFPVSADNDGINVAGWHIQWKDIVDDNNVSIQDSLKEGYYRFQCGNGEAGVYVSECKSLAEVAEAINNSIKTRGMVYKTISGGIGSEQAVDITTNRVDTRVDNSNVSAAAANLKLRADNTGVWLEDDKGNTLSASKKTWADMGINNWNKGSDISEERQYSYNYISGNYNIELKYNLSAETNMDSIIKGFNNAILSCAGTTRNNETSMSFHSGNNVISGTLTQTGVGLSVTEQDNLGRDFNQKNGVFNSANLVYDSTAKQFETSFTGASGNLVYRSTSLMSESEFNQRVDGVVQGLLSGKYADSNINVNITMKSTIGGHAYSLSYRYKLSASMVAAADGEYVSDGAGGYKRFNAADYPDPSLIPARYNINKPSYDDMMNNIAGSSRINIGSTDYDYVSYSVDELSNSTKVVQFANTIEEEGGLWIQAGAGSGQGMWLRWNNFSSHKLGLAFASVATSDLAGDMISRVDEAMQNISATRSDFGAYTNRLEHAVMNADNMALNLQDAESKIRDTDMAKEVMKLSKSQILMQASQAMLTHNFDNKQWIMNLLG